MGAGNWQLAIAGCCTGTVGWYLLPDDDLLPDEVVGLLDLGHITIE